MLDARFGGEWDLVFRMMSDFSAKMSSGWEGSFLVSTGIRPYSDPAWGTSFEDSDLIGKKKRLNNLLEEARLKISELEARRERFASILESIAVGTSEAFFLIAQSGRLERVSQAAEEMLGASASDLTGKPFSSLFVSESWNSISHQLAKTSSGGEAVLECEAVMLAAGERKLLTRLRLIPSHCNGNSKCLVAIADRVSEGDTSSRLIDKFASAVEKTEDSVVIANREGVIEYVNPAFERITGYSREEAVGKTPRILKSGRHGTGFYKHLWSTILSGEPFRHLLVNRRKNGELFYEEQTITPIRGPQGRIAHFVSTGRDVTIRRQRQREQEVFIAFSTHLRRTRSRRELIPAILSETRQLLHMEASAMAFCERDSDRTTLVGGNGSWAQTAGVETELLERMSDHVISTRCPYISADLGSDPLFSDHSEIRGLTSLAGVPLIAHGQPVGVLWIGRHWTITEEELHLLITLGETAANALFRSAGHEETAQRLRRFTALHAIDMTISSGLDLRVNLEVLLGHVLSQLEVDAASILLLNPETRLMELAGSRGFLTGEIRRRVLRVGEGYVGKAVLERQLIQIHTITDVNQSLVRNPPLKGEDFSSYFVAPLIARDQVTGVLEVFHRLPLEPDPDWLAFLETVAVQAAVAVEKATLVEELKESNQELMLAYDATIEGWARAIDLREGEEAGHTSKMACATVHLASVFGIPNYELAHVRRGALLHDVGKLGIPDSILQKRDPLTESDWKLIRHHPVLASQILGSVDYLRSALDIPYCHHEHWDGQGYPRGIRGEGIPVPARVFSVIDVWKALSSDRPFRKAWEEDHIREHINGLKATQFDPQVVEVFNSEFDTLKKLTSLEQSSPSPQGLADSGNGHRSTPIFG